MVALQAHLQPLLDQMQAQGFGTQDIGAGQLAAFQMLCALPRGIERSGHMLGEGQRHARGDDLVLQHVVAQQFKPIERL